MATQSMTPLGAAWAWRELRGGVARLRRFRRLHCARRAAIAGVGSVADSLADGLSRAGGLILGGDIAFSLVQREATESSAPFSTRSGTLSAVATLPTMARTGDGRTPWSRSRRWTMPIRCFGTVDDGT